MRDYEPTWEDSVWHEYTVADAVRYLKMRMDAHDTWEQNLVGLALEVQSMPKDFLVHLVVHYASKDVSE